MDRHQIRALSHSPERWELVTDEILRLVGSPTTREQTVLAAVLDSGPGAFLSHMSVAHWWGLSGCALHPLHVVRTSASRRRTELARLHRVRDLPQRWTTTHLGVPVARPELLALQLFAVCRFERAERLVDRLWSSRLLSGWSLDHFVHDYCRRGRDGSAGLRAYLEPRGVGYVPPDSGLESRFDQIVRGEELEFRRQVHTGGEERWTGRVDFRHESLPLVIEIQSEMYHSSLVDRRADDLRLAELRASGFVVVEITDTLVWTRPDLVVAMVREGVGRARRHL